MQVVVEGARYDERVASYPEPLREAGATPHGLVRGDAHHVHGMALFGADLHVLVLTASLRVSWVPLGLVRLTDTRLPAAWRFRGFERELGLRAVWGYPALLDDASHSDDLTVERRRSAVRTFLDQCDREDLSGVEVDRLGRLAGLVGTAGER